MKAVGIQLHSEGRLSLEALEVSAPGEGLLRLEMLAAPVNPADLNVIEGTYPRRPLLPGVIGNEGVGRVAAVGPGVEGFREGDLVITVRTQGSWCTARVVPAAEAFKVPDGVPLLQAAMMSVNPPTAWRMLHDFQPLEKGDWVIQNAANSGVGRAVIGLARHLGIRTVNVVRSKESGRGLAEAGADVVLVDDGALARQVKALALDAPPRLALNAVGGRSASELAKTLASGGTLVTYGAMGLEPVTVGNGLLIFKDIRVRGFFITGWYERASREDVEGMFSALAPALCAGVLDVPVAGVYPLERWPEALEHAARGGRGGKILFTMNGGEAA